MCCPCHLQAGAACGIATSFSCSATQPCAALAAAATQPCAALAAAASQPSAALAAAASQSCATLTRTFACGGHVCQPHRHCGTAFHQPCLQCELPGWCHPAAAVGGGCLSLLQLLLLLLLLLDWLCAWLAVLPLCALLSTHHTGRTCSRAATLQASQTIEQVGDCPTTPAAGLVFR